MNITEFLEARIAEDEEVATRAAGGSNGVWGIPWEDEPRIEGDNMTIYDEGGHNNDQAEHIATHDPKRVLAECAAKRAIIERWEDPSGYWLGAPDVDDGRLLATDRAVRALAAVYADHPDYQQEWATT